MGEIVAGNIGAQSWECEGLKAEDSYNIESTGDAEGG